MRRSRDLADSTHFLEIDQLFHRAIAHATQNVYLDGCADRILTLNAWLWHIYFDTRGTDSHDLFVHDPIIEALAAHDAAAAETAMREHILCSKEQLLTGL